MFDNHPVRDIVRYHPTTARATLLGIIDGLIGFSAYLTGTRWALNTAIVLLIVIMVVGTVLIIKRGEHKAVHLRWNGREWEKIQEEK